MACISARLRLGIPAKLVLVLLLSAAHGYFSAAVIYWAFCFGMSRYSQMIEQNRLFRLMGSGKFRDLLGIPRPFDYRFANPLNLVPAANRVIARVAYFEQLVDGSTYPVARRAPLRECSIRPSRARRERRRARQR